MNYYNNNLGCTYNSDKTEFRVWSPDATDVRVQLFKTGSDEEQGAQKLESYGLKLDSHTGIWSVVVFGDLKNLYYTYLVTVNGQTKETQDVYSKAVGVNGRRSMVCDMESTNPEGWEADRHVFVKRSTDAIIWEVHVGDFSGDASSGVSEAHRGKYLAFTEEGTSLLPALIILKSWELLTFTSILYTTLTQLMRLIPKRASTTGATTRPTTMFPRARIPQIRSTAIAESASSSRWFRLSIMPESA